MLRLLLPWMLLKPERMTGTAPGIKLLCSDGPVLASEGLNALFGVISTVAIVGRSGGLSVQGAGAVGDLTKL
jgi:hypothetical protein